jgi:arylsulfatase A-like enzyme
VKKAATLAVLTATLLITGYISLNRSSDPRPPNILLISVDTLSREHVSAYGYSRATTPTLDRLADEGALFTDAVSTSNWTLPAQLSALSALSPASHRVEDKKDSLPDSVKMLAEVLKIEGFATAGFVSHIYLDEKFGFARGFDSYENDPDQQARSVTAKAADWLSDHAGERFFLFLHYFDPHWKLRPPPEFQKRFAPPDADLAHGDFRFLFNHLDPNNPMTSESLADISGLYDAEVAYTDHSIGLLTDRLRPAGVLDNTIVVIFSDHGEEIGEHGAFGHGTHLHGEISGVPMIIRYPERIPGGTIDRTPAAITDIPATILALAGIQTPAQFLEEGTALLEEPTNQYPGRLRVVESSRWGPKRFAVMRNGYKLMTAATYQPVAFERRADGGVERFQTPPVIFADQLYRVREDPGEITDLLAGVGEHKSDSIHARIAEELRHGLLTYLETNNSDVRIICESAIGDPLSYDGTIQNSGILRDEPYGYPPAPGTVIRRIDHSGYHFRMHPARSPAGIVIPLPRTADKLTISLSRDGVKVFEGSVPLPRPGESIALGPAASGCSLAVPIPRHAAQSEPVTLDAHELDTLRSLGYIE